MSWLEPAGGRLPGALGAEGKTTLILITPVCRVTCPEVSRVKLVSPRRAADLKLRPSPQMNRSHQSKINSYEPKSDLTRTCFITSKKYALTSDSNGNERHQWGVVPLSVSVRVSPELLKRSRDKSARCLA